jgi:subtilase family serine protease
MSGLLSMRRGVPALIAIVLAGAGAVPAVDAIRSDRASRPAHRSVSPRLLGPASPTQPIDFSLVLRLPGRARLDRFLAAVQDSRSPDYRHFIGPRTFGARYGASDAAIRAAERRLAAAGIVVTRKYPQRTALEARGRVSAVSSLFGVRLGDYADARGRRFHAPLRSAVVPRALTPVIAGVAGLDTRPLKRPGAVPTGGLKPQDTALAYNLAPLHRQGIRGQGQTIAIASFASFEDADPAAFAQRFGLKGPAPKHVPLPGQVDTSPSFEVETNLDIDVIRSVAPGAQILVYEAPLSDPFGKLFDKIVADRRADIASMSWGACEFYYHDDDRQRDSQSIAAAQAAGVTIFNSNGDRGAYNCQNVHLYDTRLSVEWPTSSPGIVSVGATRLYLDRRQRYIRETAWENVLSAAGGGGGLTTVDARPPWQSALGVRNSFSTGKRQIPDVSAAGDPSTGWVIYSGGAVSEVGGTSAATPFWAASMLLIRQYAQRQHAGRLGYVNPMLYRLASTPQRYPPFHDVTEGGNRYYQATRGWDYATGLGSPDVYNLARDVVAFLRARKRPG